MSDKKSREKKKGKRERGREKRETEKNKEEEKKKKQKEKERKSKTKRALEKKKLSVPLSNFLSLVLYLSVGLFVSSFLFPLPLFTLSLSVFRSVCLKSALNVSKINICEGEIKRAIKEPKEPGLLDELMQMLRSKIPSLVHSAPSAG